MVCGVKGRDNEEDGREELRVVFLLGMVGGGPTKDHPKNMPIDTLVSQAITGVFSKRRKTHSL